MSLDVVFVITCMGRTFHLKETLPLYLAQQYDNYAVLIVDWSSPDDLREYLRSISDTRLLTVRVPDKKYFSLSGARNAGGDWLIAQGITPNYLAFFDADVKLPSDFLLKNLPKLTPKLFLQRNKTFTGDLGLWGSCICPFEGWRKCRYNEEIATYGEEDNEFYAMLVANGYRKGGLNAEGIEIIPHSDELRMQFYPDRVEDIPNLKRANKLKFRAKPL